MTAEPATADPVLVEPATAEPASGRPDTPRWAWPAIATIAVVWAALLGTLAATQSNEPTLNRVQFARADALALLEVLARSGDGVRAVVKEVVPGGRATGGTVAEELAAGATVTIARFPAGAATPGRLTAAPVRRIGRGWAVADPPDSLPRLVYSLANPSDWSDLKAAAAALSAGRDPYR